MSGGRGGNGCLAQFNEVQSTGGWFLGRVAHGGGAVVQAVEARKSNRARERASLSAPDIYAGCLTQGRSSAHTLNPCTLNSSLALQIYHMLWIQLL